MTIKLDENLGSRGAAILRAAGHHVTTVAEEGLSSASDTRLGPVNTYLSASKMSTKWMKPMHHIQLLESGEYPAIALQPAEQTLDLVTSLVHLPVVLPRVRPSLERRHHGCEPQVQRQLARPRPGTRGPSPRPHCHPAAPLARSFPFRASWAWPGESCDQCRRPRQPDESWWSTRRGTPGSPRAVGMDLDDGAVQRHRLQLLGGCRRAPRSWTIHTGVDRVPKGFGNPRHLHPCSTYRIALSTCKLGMLTLPRCRGRQGSMRRSVR